MKPPFSQVSIFILIAAGSSSYVMYQESRPPADTQVLDVRNVDVRIFDNSGKGRSWPKDAYGQPVTEYSYYADNEYDHGFTAIVYNSDGSEKYSVTSIPITDKSAVNTALGHELDGKKGMNWNIQITNPKYANIDWTTKFVSPNAANGAMPLLAGGASTSEELNDKSYVESCYRDGRIYEGTFLNLFLMIDDETSFRWVLENTKVDPWVFDCSNEGLFWLIGFYGQAELFEILINHPDFKNEYLQAPLNNSLGLNGLDAFLLGNKSKTMGWIRFLGKEKVELFKMAWKRGITSGYHTKKVYECFDRGLDNACKEAYRYAEFLCANYKQHCTGKEAIAKHAKEYNLYDFDKDWGISQRRHTRLMDGLPSSWTGAGNDYLTLDNPEPRSVLNKKVSYE